MATVAYWLCIGLSFIGLIQVIDFLRKSVLVMIDEYFGSTAAKAARLREDKVQIEKTRRWGVFPKYIGKKSINVEYAEREGTRLTLKGHHSFFELMIPEEMILPEFEYWDLVKIKFEILRSGDLKLIELENESAEKRYQKRCAALWCPSLLSLEDKLELAGVKLQSHREGHEEGYGGYKIFVGLEWQTGEVTGHVMESAQYGLKLQEFGGLHFDAPQYLHVKKELPFFPKGEKVKVSFKKYGDRLEIERCLKVA